MLLPGTGRRSAADAMMCEVEVAYAHFQRYQRIHPAFGDGSLMSRALSLEPGPEPLANDPEFLQSIKIAAEALDHHFTM
ncbi:hypothetical protein [Tabrizicola sp.]|uniref:DUF7742 family protein n=1 Tax=Tabrizicola sp. TaxID=2005166 RepID=UPI00286D144D|nr:hypothetical protein [Tabrizicola sp.]